MDPQLAVVEAQRYLTASGVSGTARWTDGRLFVETAITRPTVFLSSIGISEFTVHGSGTAVVVSAG
ncbi:hypothetical protein DMA12_25005 [Amycolatopsis balhimycina DSM 5908]|uniref:Uncharacterized protein n=1 Tax=Amycolatopsis balhimycina DSM 5908 TaxID=1081091 RepID=A0A428WD94_AMYBA|nr:hypothetical protein [Amycolatopsis balhimycina]RSM41029.1 hypothetical protein DMA12_25005 [Amycolatopsis balhimycina DSM 5908]